MRIQNQDMKYLIGCTYDLFGLKIDQIAAEDASPKRIPNVSEGHFFVIFYVRLDVIQTYFRCNLDVIQTHVGTNLRTNFGT